MKLDDDERERLARALWDAYGTVLRNHGHIPPGAVASWDAQPDRVRDNYLMGAEAAAKVLLPEGTVPVERGRLERLIEYVAADLACTGWPDEDGANPFWDRYMAARGAVRAGDTETTPEPVATEGGGS